TATRMGLVQFTGDSDLTGPNAWTGTITAGGGGGFQNVTAANDTITLSVGDGGSTGNLGNGDINLIAPNAANFATTLRLNRSGTYTLPNNVNFNPFVSPLGDAILNSLHASGIAT